MKSIAIGYFAPREGELQIYNDGEVCSKDFFGLGIYDKWVFWGKKILANIFFVLLYLLFAF